ncbi:MAG: hypothetical protein Q9169_007596, partial [Polycauliona sp. 2 TL-2023]
HISNSYLLHDRTLAYSFTSSLHHFNIPPWQNNIIGVLSARGLSSMIPFATTTSSTHNVDMDQPKYQNPGVLLALSNAQRVSSGFSIHQCRRLFYDDYSSVSSPPDNIMDQARRFSYLTFPFPSLPFTTQQVAASAQTTEYMYSGFNIPEHQTDDGFSVLVDETF